MGRGGLLLNYAEKCAPPPVPLPLSFVVRRLRQNPPQTVSAKRASGDPHNTTAASPAYPERWRCRCADGGNDGVLAGKTAQTAGKNGAAMSRTTTKQFQAPYASAGSHADDM